MRKHYTLITTDDIREFLDWYQGLNNCSNIALDNIRKNLSSLFAWLHVNDYIFKASLFENVKITRKLSIIYLTVFNKDFNYYREEIILGESIIFFVQIIVMLIITVIYIGNLKQFGKENEKVNFFNKCLINSILYK